MGTYKDLTVYQKSFKLAIDIFWMTKKFPKEELYSLTDQIRRSSRSTNLCIVEAYRKRRYPAHFVSKLTDSDMENSETQGWLEFAKECNYVTIEEYTILFDLSEEVSRMLAHMITNPEKFCNQKPLTTNSLQKYNEIYAAVSKD